MDFNDGIHGRRIVMGSLITIEKYIVKNSVIHGRGRGRGRSRWKRRRRRKCFFLGPDGRQHRPQAATGVVLVGPPILVPPGPGGIKISTIFFHFFQKMKKKKSPPPHKKIK